MDYLKSILSAVGSVVDKAVPFAVGARTKLAVVACPVLGSVAVKAVVGSVFPPALAAIPVVQALLCSAAPLFALAGLVRDPSKG